jgi:aspartyl-tRNA(Asn)/glutamyl-tRNA(Gln) amidotransferase subunit A
MQTIHAAADEIRQGRLTPVELLEACLRRIDELEPRVRAWVFVDRERARADAQARANELRGGDWRGPLHGIPLGVKDIIDVFDWPTACGSKLWQNSVARQDAPVVRRLREAGAVFVGKTVTTQYASFDPPPTRNPWRLDRTPGGSSSGSAAAVACGMCLAALGSQTGGSICRPAAYCGVVGLKPSYGRVSCDGLLPLAHSMDHPGPITRCVRDAALLLQAMAGGEDPEAGWDGVPDYTAALDAAPAPPVVGRLRGYFAERAEPAMVQHLDAVCAALRERGAVVEEVALPASFAEVEARHGIVMAVEAAQYHEDRLRRHPEDYRPNITKLLNQGLSCPAPEYARTKEHQVRLANEMLRCFTAADVLLAPVVKGPAPDAATTGDPVFCSPWSYTGLPSINLPTGRSAEGLPLAVQFIGQPFDEAKLLAAAAWCEAVLGVDLGEPPVRE